MSLVSSIKKSAALVAVAATLATGGVIVQQTALPDVASAATSWWAKNTMCYNNQIRYTWYRVIDYSWYEETFQGKIDYNYPNLYYPDHYEYTGIYCTRA
jgi:hypothetical protein